MITFTLRVFKPQHSDCYTFILCTVSRSLCLIQTSHLILVTSLHEKVYWICTELKKKIIVDHLNCKMLVSVSNTVPRQWLLVPPQDTAQQSCVSTLCSLWKPQCFCVVFTQLNHRQRTPPVKGHSHGLDEEGRCRETSSPASLPRERGY